MTPNKPEPKKCKKCGAENPKDEGYTRQCLCDCHSPELKYCDKCIQMTNHTGETCLKCGLSHSPSSGMEWEKPRKEHCSATHGKNCPKCYPADWEKMFDIKFESFAALISMKGLVGFRQYVKSFISQSISEAYKRGKHDGFAEEGVNCDKHCEEARVDERRKVIEEIESRACAFANCLDPKDVLKSITHQIYKNPHQNAKDFLFVGKAQAYQDIISTLTKEK